MNRSKLASVLVLLTALIGRGWAGDLREAAIFTAQRPRWSISAGATVRSIDADFHVARPAPLSPGPVLGSGRSGRGDAGIFRGGLGSVHYDDGSVGPDYGVAYDTNHLPTGDAGGLISLGSQLTGSGRSDSFSVPISELAFHSSEISTRYQSTNALHGLNASDSEVGVGPYLTLSYELRGGGRDSLSVSMGWSYVQTQHGISGALGVQSIQAQRTRSRYTYRYDYDGAGGALAPGAQFPFQANQLGEGFIIYDPSAYAAAGNGTGFLPPRKSVSATRSSEIAAILVPMATTRLRVALNEVVFAASYERHLTNRLHVGFSLGPTLNVIDSTLGATVAWMVNGRSAPVASSTAHTSSTAVKVGLMGQMALTFDLTRQMFMEAHGSFRWVDPVDVGGPLATVRVNPSSWEGGLGVGWRF